MLKVCSSSTQAVWDWCVYRQYGRKCVHSEMGDAFKEPCKSLPMPSEWWLLLWCVYCLWRQGHWGPQTGIVCFLFGLQQHSEEILSSTPAHLSIKKKMVWKAVSTTDISSQREEKVSLGSSLPGRFSVHYLGLVWIIMKWLSLDDKFRLYCPDHV